MEIKYRIEFLSDWHIGSGTGIPGIIDNGVLKDNNNIPVISGKTIKGLVKNSLEDLNGLTKSNQNIIDEIFGIEGNGIENIGKAIFYNPKIIKEEDEQRLRSNFSKFKDIYRDNPRSIRTHTGIDNDTGTAKKNNLFSEEVSSSDFVFYGKIEVEEKYAKYIISALRFITKIGGKRRRGLGYCEINVLDVKENKKIEEYIEEFINGSV